MANKSRFIIAESNIKSFFKEGMTRVYTREELAAVLDAKRVIWNLPISWSADKFIDRLLSSEILLRREIVFEGYLPKKERFIIPGASPFEVAVSLIKKAYLSHYSAVYLHGLTNQIPKTIYISFEQSKKMNVDRDLEQKSIDSAFSKPQRKSTTTTIYEDYTFLIHNGMYSNRAGIYTLDNLPVTNIERTLIDITVRPTYAGGVNSVLEVYRKAIDKISLNKLVATLDKLNFIYPYHQSIGFYLEKAGYDVKKLDTLRHIGIDHNFYLTYQMQEKEFDEKWKIYYPTGM